MKVSLNWQPFNEFWYTCFFSNYNSILMSLDSSYKNRAYMNDYYYVRNGMMLEVMKSNYREKDEIVSLKEIKFKDSNNIVQEVKDYINKGIGMLLNIDMFYWINNNVFYKIEHFTHLSLITGYDEEEKVFYVFDKNRNIYNEEVISEENFQRAFDNRKDKECQAKLILINKDIEPFKLSISEIIKNAEKRIKNISNITFEDLWIIDKSENSYMDIDHQLFWISININRIIEMNRANEKLFGVLRESGYIEDDCYKKLNDSLNITIKVWSELKSLFIKYRFIKKTDYSLEPLYYMAEEALNSEKQMWINLCDYYKSKNRKVLVSK